jgi:surfactin synthase thioesterase subunit
MIHVPVLAIGGALDMIARAKFMESTRSWTTFGFETKILNRDH